MMTNTSQTRRAAIHRARGRLVTTFMTRCVPNQTHQHPLDSASMTAAMSAPRWSAARMSAMSKTSPDDLVVAFRSFVRRENEALEAADGAAIGGYVGEVQQHLAQAGALVGAPPDPAAIADAIAATPADAFDVPTLDGLREHAIRIGSLLRRIGEAHHVDD